jgi:hypothetical protein
MHGRRERLAVVDPRAGSEPGLMRTSGDQLWPPSVDRVRAIVSYPKPLKRASCTTA